MMKSFNTALEQINLILLPLIAVVLVPFVVWVNSSVNANNSAHEKLANHIDMADAAIIASTDTKLANQPPTDWKDRVLRLEAGAAQQVISTAELKIMVGDIRTRLFSEPKTANK